MINAGDSRPIGIFDSGVGGVSVLREAIKVLPHEDFLYYGDTLNAPYGVKKPKEVECLASNVVDILLARSVKAIVIACNTATSAAAEGLRQTYPNLPIIGMEPALKPASEMRNHGMVLVLATPVTLQLPKFQHLMALYGQNAVPLPCPGLMDFVERGELHGDILDTYLNTCFAPYQNQPVDAVVLGCTHYVFLANEISRYFPAETHIIDGNQGTVRQLQRRLEYGDALNKKAEAGSVEFITSGIPEIMIPRMKQLLTCP